MNYELIKKEDYFTFENDKDYKESEEDVIESQLRSAGIRFFSSENAPVLLINTSHVFGQTIALDKNLLFEIIKSLIPKSSSIKDFEDFRENTLKFNESPPKYVVRMSKLFPERSCERYSKWIEKSEKIKMTPPPFLERIKIAVKILLGKDY